MRISDSALFNITNNQLSQTSARISTLETEISSGLQIQQPSDNPSGAVQVAQLQDGLAQISQYQTTATQATSWLNTEDSTLQAIQSTISQANSLAVEGANPQSSSDWPRPLLHRCSRCRAPSCKRGIPR